MLAHAYTCEHAHARAGAVYDPPFSIFHKPKWFVRVATLFIKKTSFIDRFWSIFLRNTELWLSRDDKWIIIFGFIWITPFFCQKFINSLADPITYSLNFIGIRTSILVNAFLTEFICSAKVWVWSRMNVVGLLKF